MKREVKKVFVDCEERFITISQEDDLAAVETALFNYNSTEEKLRQELNLESGNQDALWDAFTARLSKAGAYLVEDNFSVEGVFVSLEAAEADAERAAHEWFENLLEADQALSATWKDVSRLVSQFEKLIPEAEKTLEKLLEAHGAMENDFGWEFGNVHKDIEDAYINQEVAVLTILTYVRRFQGKDDPENGTYRYYFSKERDFTPFTLPVRKRLK
jgi:hypothetical protein